MLASITPLGERARGGNWRRAAIAYVAGSVAGGATLGAVLGALGMLVAAGARPLLGISTTAAAATVLAGAAAALATFADGSRRVPTIRRQVDERWLTTYRDWVYGAGFGLQLGLGAVTIVTSASLYLTWSLELLTGSPWLGLAVGATFGLARALPLLTVARAADPVSLRAHHRRWQAWLPPASRAIVATQAVAAAALVAVGAVVLA